MVNVIIIIISIIIVIITIINFLLDSSSLSLLLYWLLYLFHIFDNKRLIFITCVFFRMLRPSNTSTMTVMTFRVTSENWLATRVLWLNLAYLTSASYVLTCLTKFVVSIISALCVRATNHAILRKKVNISLQYVASNGQKHFVSENRFDSSSTFIISTDTRHTFNWENKSLFAVSQQCTILPCKD